MLLVLLESSGRIICLLDPWIPPPPSAYRTTAPASDCTRSPSLSLAMSSVFKRMRGRSAEGPTPAPTGMESLSQG